MDGDFFFFFIAVDRELLEIYSGFERGPYAFGTDKNEKLAYYFTIIALATRQFAA